MDTKKMKMVWGILVVLLLNLCMISIFIIPADTGTADSTDVLSRMGSQGTEVRKIQQRLKDWGYYFGAVDGIYGSQTQEAVKKFQKKHGLTVDGIAGSKTLAAIGISSSTGNSASNNINSNVNLLARLISSEARGEPYKGQVAVGAVVLNRMEHPSFPNTIAGVVYQEGAFSVVDNGTINLSSTSSAYRAAQDAMNGWDPSGGSIYFYNPNKTSNTWLRSREVITVIGLHRFCK